MGFKCVHLQISRGNPGCWFFYGHLRIARAVIRSEFIVPPWTRVEKIKECWNREFLWGRPLSFSNPISAC